MCAFLFVLFFTVFLETIDFHAICSLNEQRIISRLNAHTHTHIHTYIAYMSMTLLVEFDCNLSDLTKLFMELRARHITDL